MAISVGSHSPRTYGPRMLVAVSPEGKTKILSLLCDFDLHFVDSVDALLHRIDESWDAVIVGANFAESNTLLVLRAVLDRVKAMPVICVRASRGGLSKRSIYALRLASEEIGARCFIDLVNAAERPLRDVFLDALELQSPPLADV